MRDRGPAFDRLYEGLWRPGVSITARLVAGVHGRRAASDADTAQALMLISSLLAFHAGRDVSLQILGWPSLDEAALAGLDRLIDEMVGTLAGPDRDRTG